jgi:hypothetical protein
MAYGSPSERKGGGRGKGRGRGRGKGKDREGEKAKRQAHGGHLIKVRRNIKMEKLAS